MNDWNRNAPEWAKTFDKFVQNVGYGIANMFGLGEAANDLVNVIKGLTNSNTYTLNAAGLVKYLKDKLGASSIKLQQVIALIDQKLGGLPPAASQNTKKALADIQAGLLSERRRAATELSKVEQTMNTATGLAGQQDYLNPGKKQENQQLITEMAESTKGEEVAKSVERKLK